MKKRLLTFSLLLSAAALIAQPSALRINEICATNTTLASDLGNFGDWIEIYNPTGSAIDLAGLHITDDAANLTKYQIPTGISASIVSAGSHLLIWADDSAQALHTNWKVSSSGETILLVGADGSTIIDQVQTPALGSDESFGRSLDGSGSFIVFTAGNATPGSTNNPALLNNNKGISHLLTASFYNDGLVLNSRDFIQDVDLSLYGIDGKQLASLSDLTIQEGTNFTEFKLPGSGIYFLIIKNKSYSDVVKLLKW